MRNKIGYRIIALAVSCTMMYSSSALRTQAQTPSPQPSDVQLNQTNKTRSFLYTITNTDTDIIGNAVAAYARNPTTGQLTFKTSYLTGGQGDPLTLALSQDSLITDGSYLYAVNTGSNNISVFFIQKDGSLTLVGSPVSSGGVRPISLAVHNNLLYVANQGDFNTPANLAGFTINNGLLQQIPGSTITLNFNDAPGDVLFNKAGNVLIDTRVGGSIIDSYQVDSNGLLTPVSKIVEQPNAFGAAFNPAKDQQLVVNLAGFAGNASYDVSNQGDLIPINKVFDPPSGDPCWIVFNKKGTFAWTSAFMTGYISLFNVDISGALRFVSDLNTTQFSLFSEDIALSSDEVYLYQSQAQPLIPKINVFKISKPLKNAKDAGLSLVQTINGPFGTYPIGLVVVDVPNN